MPKRTNPFQHLIALIETAISGVTAAVQESEELVDKITGERREVDVFVELRDFHHKLAIAIECKGGEENPRPATVEWVEQMWGKHQSLPTDRLILVAKGGFTKAAKKKGAWWGIDCLTLEEAEACDWVAKIRKVESIEVTNFLVPFITNAELIFDQRILDSIDHESIDLASPVLHFEDGKTVKAGHLIQEWIKDPKVIQTIEEKAFDDGGTIFKMTVSLKRGTHVQSSTGATFEVRAIMVQGKCRKSIEEMGLVQKSYANAAVAHGATDGFGRKKLSFVLGETKATSPTIAVSIKPNTDANKRMESNG